MLLSAEELGPILTRTREAAKNFFQHTSNIFNMSFRCKSVAVIGAGISGVVAAAHLQKEGVEVTVFERSSAAGGIWYTIQLHVPQTGLTAEQALR